MKKMHNNGGFNIVELMIVVGIIGVLSAVVGPKLQVFYWKSFRAGAYTQLKALNTFIQVYGQDAPVPIPDTGDIGAQVSGGWAQIVTYDGSSPLSKTIDHLQASVIIYFLFFKKMALLGTVRWRRETYAKCI